MTVDTLMDPRTYSFSAVGLVSLAALFGTSVPVAREAEPEVSSAFYVPWVSFAGDAVPVAASAGAVGAVVPFVGDLIAELRSSTSFTWDQTSKLLGVSRRTVHLWAAGGNISAQNEERLANLVREVRAIHSTGAGDVRMQLLALLDRERSSHASRSEDINRVAPVYAVDV